MNCFAKLENIVSLNRLVSAFFLLKIDVQNFKKNNKSCQNFDSFYTIIIRIWMKWFHGLERLF